MIYSRISLLTLVLFLLNGAIYSQTIQISGQQKQEIDQLLNEFEKESAPGVILGIISNGKMIYQNATGKANIAQNKPINADTRFEVTGMTPHFIAFSTLLLEEQGLIDLETSILEYLPDFPTSYSSIKIKHLLGHSSGLPGYWPLKELMGINEGDAYSQEQFYKLISQDWELSSAPGKEFHYTGTGASLLTQIISKIKGVSYQDFFTKEILKPLGMKNSGFSFGSDGKKIEQSLAYMNSDHGPISKDNQHSDLGASGFVSSIHDMMLWYANFSNPKVGSSKLFEKLDLNEFYDL